MLKECNYLFTNGSYALLAQTVRFAVAVVPCYLEPQPQLLIYNPTLVRPLVFDRKTFPGGLCCVLFQNNQSQNYIVWSVSVPTSTDVGPQFGNFFPVPSDSYIPANTKYLYNICTTSAVRLRRWSNIVQNVIQMYCVCWDPPVMLWTAMLKKMF